MTLTQRRREALDRAFEDAFGSKPTRYFSAPGRTEIGGNHTDHQRGLVLAAAVDLDMVAAVRETGGNVIRLVSQGYPPCLVNIGEWAPRENEKNTTQALIRGVAAAMWERGCPVGGFEAYVESRVLPGSGLSSSAAFEVLIGTILNTLFFEGKATAIELATVGKKAENRYFGKPCGLMDQAASSLGGLVAIDFKEEATPLVERIDVDFSAYGYGLCILHTGANHADLTEDYAAIPREMGMIAGRFGKTVLRDVPEEVFLSEIPALRKACGDRAVLRALHFYQENRRVARQVEALKNSQMEAFLELVNESGCSSHMHLQNVVAAGQITRQDVALALALCRRQLKGAGACRVHGGGFAGTIQAYVPLERLDRFQAEMEAVLGQGACQCVAIRPWGGAELKG